LLYLGSGDRSSLDEVDTHVLLEIEVSENIPLLKLQKRSKSRVGVDLSAVGGILKIVRTNVNIDLSGNVSSSHLGSNRLSEEGCKLVTNLGGLHKSRRSAVSTLLLSMTLGGRLKLLSIVSLNRLEERLHDRKPSSNLLKIRVKLGALGINVVSGLSSSLLSLGKGLNRNGNILSGRGNNLLGLGLNLLGRLARSLLLNGCRGRSRGRGGNNRSCNGSRLRRLGLLGLLG
jgi:hypothetical protein